MGTVKIKRSSTTTIPTSLEVGELAYSWAAGADVLYIGVGTTLNGTAAYAAPIGGEYFTRMLDHQPGTLTANSAIVVDQDKKIDELRIDNVYITANMISTNGASLVVSAGGNLNVSGSRITNVAAPTNNTDAATKAYVDQAIAAALANIS